MSVLPARGLAALLEVLRTERPVVVQAHDFPDHDAVATGFALSELLNDKGFRVRLVYGGTIQSASLSDAIDQLGITVAPIRDIDLEEDAQIIVVDGFAGNANMTTVKAEVVGVIDHHPPPYDSQCPYVDIRDDYGSCSSILYDYYRQAGQPLRGTVATALLMGLMMDTAFMTRSVADIDLEAFGVLFRQADWELATRLLKNSLSLGDLAAFRQAIESCMVARDFAFISLPGEYTTEVMALVADFFLNLREITFVAVVSGERDEHRISVRSETHQYPSDVIIRRALQSIGSGGGHMHMGGGSIPRDLYPGDEGLRKRFIEALGFDREEEDNSD